MERMTRKQIREVIAYLQKCIEEGNYLFDGVDTDSYANNKTAEFIDRVGIDTAEEILVEIVDETYFSKYSNGRSWRETDAVIFRDRDLYLTVKYDCRERLYCKVFNFAEGYVPVVCLHD